MAGPVTLIFGKIGGKIGNLSLDATLSESHDYENEVSQFPVESGEDITDNIRITPDRITIEGLISNTPITAGATDIEDIIERNGNITTAKRVSRDGTPVRVESAQDILLRISGRKINGADETPELVTVVTGLRSYTGMAMESLVIKRNGSTGQALPFTAQLLKVQIVQTETIKLPNAPPKAQSKVDKGIQEIVLAPPKFDDKSIEFNSRFFAPLSTGVIIIPPGS